MSDCVTSILILFRKQLNEFLTLKIQEKCVVSDSDSDGDSSSDEEVLAVMCELLLAPKIARGVLLNLEDLSPLECEQLFRYKINVLQNCTHDHFAITDLIKVISHDC